VAGQLPRIVSDSIPGPESRKLADRLRRAECAEITFLTSDFPIFWNQARGCLVTDVDDNTLLDATASFGVMALGHGHPAVIRAINVQSRRLIHGMGDVHPSDAKVKLLEAIQSHVPIADARIILGQNGSDSVEAALKTALLATGRSGVLAFEGGYHGLGYGALEPTARGFFRDPFDAQRGHFAAHLPYGCEMSVVRDHFLSSQNATGAVIVEPVQGRGGMRVPDAGWLAALKAECGRHGALLIVDEIFTGWGRTGEWFACTADSVVPDLLCIGKSMGGGMPISACVGSRSLMEAAWGAGSTGEARHTYTFLGHPLSCASAVATIDVLERDGLVDRCRVIGAELMAGLRSLATAHPAVVKEARGRGLMTGLALQRPGLAAAVMLGALRLGLIVLPAGDAGDVVELVPPFVIGRRQVAWVLDTLDTVFRTVAQ
jgi:4-aminobutyrate aminotransferase-like enzyme